MSTATPTTVEALIPNLSNKTTKNFKHMTIKYSFPQIQKKNMGVSAYGITTRGRTNTKKIKEINGTTTSTTTTT